MRTASQWGRIAAHAACLVAVAAAGLVATDQASAQTGYMMYGGAPTAQNAYMMYGGVPMAQNGGMMYAAPAAQNSLVAYNGAMVAQEAPQGPGNPEAGQVCCACQGQGSERCGGCDDGDGARRHRRTLLETDYWDGRRKCAECPYGMDNNGHCSDPKWEVTAAGLLMSRTHPRKGIIVGDNFGVSRISTDDIGEIDWAAGPRVTAVRRFENFDFEAIYWGIDAWDSANVVFGSQTNPLTVPVFGLNQYAFESVNVEYRHRLYNLEGNLKIRWGEAVNILLGTRVMEFHERLFLDAEPGDVGPVMAGCKAEAANYLYGLQIGADTDVPAWFGIKFNAFIKAGVFKNHVREFLTRRSNFLPEIDSSSVDTEIAFVGEAGATVTYQFHKNIGVFGGYEWMFIDGVVLAPDMISQTTVRTNTPIYQGALAGVKVQW